MQSLVKGESIEYSIKFIEFRELKGEYRIYLHIYLLMDVFSRIILMFNSIEFTLLFFILIYSLVQLFHLMANILLLLHQILMTVGFNYTLSKIIHGVSQTNYLLMLKLLIM